MTLLVTSWLGTAKAICSLVQPLVHEHFDDLASVDCGQLSSCASMLLHLCQALVGPCGLDGQRDLGSYHRKATETLACWPCPCSLLQRNWSAESFVAADLAPSMTYYYRVLGTADSIQHPRSLSLQAGPLMSQLFNFTVSTASVCWSKACFAVHS